MSHLWCPWGHPWARGQGTVSETAQPCPAGGTAVGTWGRASRGDCSVTEAGPMAVPQFPLIGMSAGPMLVPAHVRGCQQ